VVNQKFTTLFPDPLAITVTQMKSFIDKYFATSGLPFMFSCAMLKYVWNLSFHPGNELIEHFPDDWMSSPQSLALIKDPRYRDW